MGCTLNFSPTQSKIKLINSQVSSESPLKPAHDSIMSFIFLKIERYLIEGKEGRNPYLERLQALQLVFKLLGSSSRSSARLQAPQLGFKPLSSSSSPSTRLQALHITQQPSPRLDVSYTTHLSPHLAVSSFLDCTAHLSPHLAVSSSLNCTANLSRCLAASPSIDYTIRLSRRLPRNILLLGEESKVALALMGDSRVLLTEAREVTMVDVGDKVRPSDVPPGGQGSWVNKVVGNLGGGMMRSERVLDDEFVMARISVEFPDGEDGEPVITIGQEVMDAMRGLWKRCMIVKVLGRNISIAVVSRKLRELWKPKGAMHVMDLPRHFFMVRFEEEDEYLSALTGGPWRVFGSYLMVQAWNPEFNPLRDEITTTPVWVGLSNIPVTLYHRPILMSIVRGLGKPIKVDLTTLNYERARFARVCVEVDLRKPLKGTIMINGERYGVSYEGLANICSMCGLYGHLVHSCPRKPREEERVVPTNHPAEGGRKLVGRRRWMMVLRW